MCAKLQICIIKTVGGDVPTIFVSRKRIRRKKLRTRGETISLCDRHRDLTRGDCTPVSIQYYYTVMYGYDGYS